jgi:hypothetical protein
VNCRWCGRPIRLEQAGPSGDMRYFHVPPYAWGSHLSRIPSPFHTVPEGERPMFFVDNPCWQNGLYCDPAGTHYAEREK